MTWHENCTLLRSVTMQPDVHGDIITAVTCFADNHNLMPAFDGAVTTQLGSSIDVPPSYDQVERLLQVNVHTCPCSTDHVTSIICLARYSPLASNRRN